MHHVKLTLRDLSERLVFDVGLIDLSRVRLSDIIRFIVLSRRHSVARGLHVLVYLFFSTIKISILTLQEVTHASVIRFLAELGLFIPGI